MYLFISYDLLVICYMVDEIGVFYFGCLVEVVDWDFLFDNLCYFYIWMLMDVVLYIDVFGCMVEIVLGEILDLINKFSGCSFYLRCELIQDWCCQECFEVWEFGVEKVWVVCYLCIV